MSASPALLSAHDALPWWVGIGRLAVVPLVALLVFAFSALAIRLALRSASALPADTHWTERARVLFPARTSAGAGPWLATGGVVAIVGVFLSEPSLAPVGSTALLVSCALASFLAACAAMRQLDRHYGRSTSLAAGLRQLFSPLVWLAPQLTIAVVGGFLLPSAGLPRALGALGLIVLSCVALRVGTLRLAALLRIVRRADARVTAIVERAAQRVGQPAPRTFVAPLGMVNAFAFVHSRELCLTEPAVRALRDDELGAIVLHELGHLSEPRRVRLLRGSLSLVWVMSLAFFALADLAGVDGWWAIGASFLLLFVILQRFKVLSRRMEDRADAFALAHEPEPGLYARALERLHELNLLPVVMVNATHPSAYDRFIATGLTPSYPRPVHPARMGGLGALLLAAIPPMLLLSALLFAAQVVGGLSPNLALALLGTPSDVWTAATARWQAGEMEGAIALYSAQSKLLESQRWAVVTARAYSEARRCDEAEHWLVEARRRPANERYREELTTTEHALQNCRANAAYDLGRARWMANDLAGALPHYQRASAAEPRETYWAAETARLLSSLGRCQEARAMLADAEGRPHDSSNGERLVAARNAVGSCRSPEANALGEQGLAKWTAGDREGALAAYEQARQLEPEYWAWLLALARVTAELERCDASLQWLHAAAQRASDPQAVTYLNQATAAIEETCPLEG